MKCMNTLEAKNLLKFNLNQHHNSGIPLWGRQPSVYDLGSRGGTDGHRVLMMQHGLTLRILTLEAREG